MISGDFPRCTHRGKAGDYLVRGVRGELYRVEKEIFEETYEFLDGVRYD